MTGCPRGCSDDPAVDDCKASIAIPCPQRRYEAEADRFQPCGCLERERCADGCGCCLNCDGCFCGEE